MSLITPYGAFGSYAVPASPMLYNTNLAAVSLAMQQQQQQSGGPILASSSSNPGAGVFQLRPEPASATTLGNIFSVTAPSVAPAALVQDPFTASALARQIALGQAGFLNNGSVAAGPYNYGNHLSYNVVSDFAATNPLSPLEVVTGSQLYNPMPAGGFARVAGSGLLERTSQPFAYPRSGCGCSRF
jgi:hypothetical protein